MKKKEKNSKDPFFEEALSGVKADIRLTLKLLSFFFVFALFCNFIVGISLSFVVFIVLFVWILLYLSHYRFIKDKKNRKELSIFHFRNTFVDLLLLTIIIHYLGGVEWMGAIFYVAVLAWTSNVLQRKQSFILAFSAIFLYSILALLEYLEVLPHRGMFGPSPGFYQNPAYITIQILALTAIFLFVVQNYGSFAEALRKKQEKLVETQREIEEAKSVLEIKVKARTKELEELAGKLEDQVKERTEELRTKMEELEKFNKIAVGRELKMIELKKEVEGLREKRKN